MMLSLSDICWPLTRRKDVFDRMTPLDTVLLSPLNLLIQYLYCTLLFLRGAPFKPPQYKPTIRVVCISDTHTNTPSIPDGDLLIHAGDLTNAGTVEEIQAQLDWLDSLPHKHKVFIAGNHDSYFDPRSRRSEDKKSRAKLNYRGLHYLQDHSLQLKFQGGRALNLFGAPDIPQCGGSEHAFQYQHDHPPWSNRIPLSTDLLITHTPPRSHLDLYLGCPGLLVEIWRVQPRLHIFGHVHVARGRESVFWDKGQAAYERIMGRKKTSVLRDCLPSVAWLDSVKVLWYGVKGVLWQHLMLGSKGANGGLLINTAFVAQVVDL